MNQNYLTQGVLLSVLFAAALTRGQAAEPTSQALKELRPSEPELKYRVGVSYRLGYEIPVTFKNLGVVPLRNDPGPRDGTRQDHHYDNGYVLPDSRVYPDYATWNWGFTDPSQFQSVPGVPGASLSLQSTSSPGTSHEEDEFQNGFEITFSRQLGKIRRCRWGVEGAFNFLDVSTHDSDTLYGPLTVTTDTYGISEETRLVIQPDPSAPPIPHTGTYLGPGPLITDYPASRNVQTLAGATTITGSRSFEATMLGLRLGPYLEMPLSESISFTLSGGFALVYVDSDYGFRETSSIAGVPVAVPTGSSSHGDWMPGGYVAGNLSVALSRRWALTAGAQFMDVGKYTQTAGGTEATLDLSQAIFVTLGLSYSF
jgi:hypothetical protein